MDPAIFCLSMWRLERNLARNTQASYRDTLTLLLPFAGAQAPPRHRSDGCGGSGHRRLFADFSSYIETDRQLQRIDPQSAAGHH